MSPSDPSPTTDHRKIADRLLFPSGNPTPNEHLLAALHDEQRDQTVLLREMLNTLLTLRHDNEVLLKREPCPCGCRLSVEPVSSPYDPQQWVDLTDTHEHEWEQRSDLEECAHCGTTRRAPEPAPEPETVVLSRDMVGATVTRLRGMASVILPRFPRTASTLSNLADDLDAANGSQP